MITDNDPATLASGGAQEKRPAKGSLDPTLALGCSFDPAHAIYFLDAVFGDVSSGRLGLSVIKTNRQWGRSAHFQWLRFGAAWADQQDQAKPQGIYFRVTMLPPEGIKGGRGVEADSHALAFLWADVDYGTIGHKPPPGATLPPDEDAAHKIISKLPTPSLIVHSGGGLYPIWVYERPIFLTEAKRAEARARSQRWQNLIAAHAAKLGWHYGSGVGDLARVLRLPGSINRKVPEIERPCRVIATSGEVLPTW